MWFQTRCPQLFEKPIKTFVSFLATLMSDAEFSLDMSTKMTRCNQLNRDSDVTIRMSHTMSF